MCLLGGLEQEWEILLQKGVSVALGYPQKTNEDIHLSAHMKIQE